MSLPRRNASASTAASACPASTPTTQRWALSLFRWFPEAHGLRYLPRHAGEHRNYCVFVDRCAGKLSSEEHGTISSLRDLVLLAADTYYLEVHWDG